jgi:hypothetical protein
MRKSAFLLFLLLAGCAEPLPLPPGHIIVAPGIALDLPPPASLGREIEAVQMVTARHGTQNFTFEAHLSVTNERVLLAGTDGFGQRLMELRWTGEKLTSSKASWLPEALQPEYVLADVMLIYWPDAALQQRLSGLKIAADGTRRIGRPGEDLLTVTYDGDPWTGTAHLTNLAWDYEIEVRSSLVTP